MGTKTGYRLLIIFKSNENPFRSYHDIVGCPWPSTETEIIDYTRAFARDLGEMYEVTLYEGDRLIPHLDKVNE